MTDAALLSSGIVLIIIVTIAYGGTFLLQVVNGQVPTNDLQKSYFRAGHAHAGVLVILGLLIRLLTAQEGVPGWADQWGTLVLWAAIAMPAGFFLSVVGRNPERPNGLRALIWLGALFLSVGVVVAGAGLVVAGTR